MNLRGLAEGQACDFRAPGICNRRDETTVLAHIKCGHYGSIKPSDLAAIRACADCHDLIDGRTHHPEWPQQRIDAECCRALVQRLNDYTKKRIVKW